METPRWLADEMLGRLARYLRFLGHDTEYARGLSDMEIRDRVRRENRILITRDRALAAVVPGALLLRTPRLDEQLRAVREAFPAFSYDITFDRCGLCNGPLERTDLPTDSSAPRNLPSDRVRAGLPLYRCVRCHQYFWEGSHTAGIRRRLGTVFGSG